MEQHYRNNKNKKTAQSKRCTEQTAPKPVIEVDFERYEHFLDAADLTAQERRAFLEAVWNILRGFIDLGFGVHPVQQAQKACGEFAESSNLPPVEHIPEVEWKPTLIDAFLENSPSTSGEAQEEAP